MVYSWISRGRRRIRLTIFVAILCLLGESLLLTGCGKDAYLKEEFQEDTSSTQKRVESRKSKRDTEDEGTTRDIRHSAIYVYVCGQVKKPGVYKCEPGQRAQHAVDMAGGFTKKADREAVNMAEELTDGMQLTIPKEGEVEQAAAGSLGSSELSQQGAGSQQESTGALNSSSDSSQSKGALVNLNSASKDQLMTLNGIGESRAEDIIAYRQENGLFSKVEDLMNVSGIGEGIFQKIKDSITV
ncbi:MAG: helix-hairpin-helix domain-containing protein [Lachnospiraceae bacterium]|nr:helix-hairpin-helix domain-containing protein [Lachnospiraceae bacterium]